MLLKNGYTLIDNKFVKSDILIVKDRIKDIGKGLQYINESTVDCDGLYILPGAIDIHSHGANGVDINSCDKNGLDNICSFFASRGVTAFLGSILTDCKDNTIKSIKTLDAYVENSTTGAKLMGIHLEGPFLSEKYCGAMPLKLLLNIDLSLLKEYLSLSKNVRYITVAPELNGADSLIEYLCKKKINVAMGHSNATYNEAKRAIDLGVRSATHLFNAMRALEHHDLGIAGASLLEDIYVEIIADGLHLSKETIELVFRVKDIDKIIAITDSIMATNLKNGIYKLGINNVEVRDNNAMLLNSNVRAGSTLDMNKALKNLISFLEIPLERLWRVFSRNPARLMGFNDMGDIKIGNFADFAILDKEYNNILTIVNGNIVFENKE